MRRPLRLALLVAMMGSLLACASPGQVEGAPRVIEVHATPAVQPWLADLYACAPPGTVLRAAANPAEAELALRLGEPLAHAGALYRLGNEQLLVVAGAESPLAELSAPEVQELFAGLGDPPVQVWVYDADQDVQQVFSSALMDGRPLTTQARLATGPERMRQALEQDPEALGLLPGRWGTGTLRVLHTLPDVPVLALVPPEPQAGLLALLACAAGE